MCILDDVYEMGYGDRKSSFFLAEHKRAIVNFAAGLAGTGGWGGDNAVGCVFLGCLFALRYRACLVGFLAEKWSGRVS